MWYDQPNEITRIQLTFKKSNTTRRESNRLTNWNHLGASDSTDVESYCIQSVINRVDGVVGSALVQNEGVGWSGVQWSLGIVAIFTIDGEQDTSTNSEWRSDRDLLK